MLLERGVDPNLYDADRHETHPISCALTSGKPLTEIRLIMHALADGGAVIPHRFVMVLGTHVGSEDVFSLLSPFFEASR
jgi:hypothetical protein